MANSAYSPLPNEIEGFASAPMVSVERRQESSMAVSVFPTARGREQFIGSSNLSNVESQVDENTPFTSGTRPAGVYLPYLSSFLILSTAVVFYLTDSSDCSQPLSGWIFAYMFRHVSKSILFTRRERLLLVGHDLPPLLIFLLAFVDLAGPVIWTLGGYYIFHTSTCNTGLYLYACFLWGLQSMGLLLPCFFLSIVLFCAPCLLWLAPYIIRPNPNTIATGREVMSKLSKVRFHEIDPNDSTTSCSICLGDYVSDEEIIKLPCGHIFHSVCIESWLGVSQLCPVDRRNVADLVRSSPRTEEV